MGFANSRLDSKLPIRLSFTQITYCDLSSFTLDLKTSPEEVFSEIQQCVGTANYKVKDIIPNQSVIAEGKRDFSWAIVIILAILLWPAAIVYYFTRQRSSVTASITKNSTGCNLTATSNGHSSEDLMKLIKNNFKSENRHSLLYGPGTNRRGDLGSAD